MQEEGPAEPCLISKSACSHGRASKYPLSVVVYQHRFTDIWGSGKERARRAAGGLIVCIGDWSDFGGHGANLGGESMVTVGSCGVISSPVPPFFPITAHEDLRGSRTIEERNVLYKTIYQPREVGGEASQDKNFHYQCTQ